MAREEREMRVWLGVWAIVWGLSEARFAVELKWPKQCRRGEGGRKTKRMSGLLASKFEGKGREGHRAT